MEGGNSEFAGRLRLRLRQLLVRRPVGGRAEGVRQAGEGSVIDGEND